VDSQEHDGHGWRLDGQLLFCTEFCSSHGSIRAGTHCIMDAASERFEDPAIFKPLQDYHPVPGRRDESVLAGRGFQVFIECLRRQVEIGKLSV